MNTSRLREAGDAIEFRGVWKTFALHHGQSLLRHTVSALWRRRAQDEFHALQDVSFTLARGGGLAIVGRNGAGKSTLLSLVAGLSRPDRGTVKVSGRVGALLELGTGMHPDLTGRENLHLNAAMVGMTRRETRDKEEAIVEFAELHDFIEEPLRTYSQGMRMRLAFSIAAHAEPEILIVDEVLAVGDARFQERCRQQILSLRDGGCTFLFVSHSSREVLNYCGRAIWLEQGRVMMDGEVESVVEAYARDSKGVPSTPHPQPRQQEPA